MTADRSAVEEYREYTSACDRSADRSVLNMNAAAAFGVMDKADAAIKELQATIEGLKCCGNCGEYDECLYQFAPHSSCHFTPSRWTPRKP